MRRLPRRRRAVVAHTRATAVSLLSCRALATPRRSTVKPARVRSVYVKSKRTCTREGVRVRVRARVRVKVKVRDIGIGLGLGEQACVDEAEHNRLET